jgi:Uncharacterized KorC regulated protein A
MSNTRIMPWVDDLPGVQVTDFPARRDQIAALMDEAGALVKQADASRAKAYFSGCTLEGDAKGKWSNEQVEQAKRRAGW